MLSPPLNAQPTYPHVSRMSILKCRLVRVTLVPYYSDSGIESDDQTAHEKLKEAPISQVAVETTKMTHHLDPPRTNSTLKRQPTQN